VSLKTRTRQKTDKKKKKKKKKKKNPPNSRGTLRGVGFKKEKSAEKRVIKRTDSTMRSGGKGDGWQKSQGGQRRRKTNRLYSGKEEAKSVLWETR